MHELTFPRLSMRIRQLSKWLSLGAATIAATTATSWAMSGTAQAAVVLRDNILIDQVIVNECLNEPLHLHGISHVVIYETVDKAGGFHQNLHVNNAQVHGETASGVKYVQAQGGAVLVRNVRRPTNIETTVTVTTILNRQGSEFPNDDLQQHTTLHFTLSAHGEFTADVENVRLECK